MNFTGGVRRAVMQYEERLAFAGLQDAFVDVSRVPGFELFRLVLRQAGFHGKIRFRQVQCFLQFEWFGHDWSACKSLPCRTRSEEHTSELQSHLNLVCRLLLEKKKKMQRVGDVSCVIEFN